MCELTENKREMFDGMRAYHQSEISHSNHAITMLLSISGVAGTAVLAILFQPTLPVHAQEIAWGLFVVVLAFSLAISITAHIKITGDHKVYSSFGQEYVKTSILLGLYEKEVPMTADKSEKLKINKQIGQGKGYQKTQAIIWTFSGILVSLTFLFAILLKNLMEQI